MKKALVFLAEGFEEIEAVSVIDVLRRGDVKTHVVSITGEYVVKGAHDLGVEADSLFEDTDLHDAGILILPGGGPGSNNLNRHDGLKAIISDYHSKGKWIAAICAAPLVFGGMGLLQGKKATCFPGIESKLTGAILQPGPVVVDGNIITGKGPGFAAAFGLQIVQELQGRAKADEVAANMLIERS